LDSKEKKFDIFLDIKMDLAQEKNYASNATLAIFLLNALSWQILENQNLGCYKPTPLKRNLALEIRTRSEITQGNLL
jgi:hypothetical protein